MKITIYTLIIIGLFILLLMTDLLLYKFAYVENKEPTKIFYKDEGLIKVQDGVFYDISSGEVTIKSEDKTIII